MYLDDGISRESAPEAPVPGLKIGDSKAAGKYCEVLIEQVSDTSLSHITMKLIVRQGNRDFQPKLLRPVCAHSDHQLKVEQIRRPIRHRGLQVHSGLLARPVC